MFTAPQREGVRLFSRAIGTVNKFSKKERAMGKGNNSQKDDKKSKKDKKDVKKPETKSADKKR